MEETLTPRRRVLGGLDTLEFGGDKDLPTIVLFHGYGADGADLAPLAYELSLPKPARWAFPAAPLELDFGGRAWFHIDVPAIERAQREGKSADFSRGEPSGLPAARQAAMAFLEELGVPWDKLILGGFSQGAMLAADLCLRAPSSPRGLVMLSGKLLNAAEWGKLAAGRKGTPFFMSHGSVDPILGFQGALAMEKLLKDAGWRGSLLRFEGGHAISQEVLEGLKDFLTRLS